MGLLTHVIVADAAEAEELCRERDANGTSEATPGLSPEKLSSLFKILSGAAQTTSRGHGIPLAAEASAEGPWVYHFPNKLVELIAAIDNSSVRTIAIEWHNSAPEFEHEKWPADVVEKLFRQLRKLCKVALEEDKSVLLWISL